MRWGRAAMGAWWMAMALMMAAPSGAAAAESREYVIIFGTGEAKLTAEAEKIISVIATAARKEKNAKIAVAGYGDGDGPNDTVLSIKRATVVTRALVHHGVDRVRIGNSPSLLPDKATGIPVHKVTVTLLN
jgi:outer membrane protein OmpA-like peptidoglycan-associated protein